mmetsp:Transcript_5383/g.17338  ORF Transcript_5383/g.17338 Transcript_5383/m.17338 type:complete len:323 (-) Transcript_5383:287-1255(-)
MVEFNESEGESAFLVVRSTRGVWFDNPHTFPRSFAKVPISFLFAPEEKAQLQTELGQKASVKAGLTSLPRSFLGAEACGVNNDVVVKEEAASEEAVVAEESATEEATIKSAAAEESFATEAPGQAAAGSRRWAVGRESARREAHAAAGAAASCSAATGRRQPRRPGRSRRPRRPCCPRPPMRASSWSWILRRRRRRPRSRPRRARGATQRWGASGSCWPSLPRRAASPSPLAVARRGRVAALWPTPLAVSTLQPLRRPRLPTQCACPQTSAHRRQPGRPPRSATPPTRRPQRCTALRRMVRRRAPHRCTPRRWRSSRCLGPP